MIVDGQIFIPCQWCSEALEGFPIDNGLTTTRMCPRCKTTTMVTLKKRKWGGLMLSTFVNLPEEESQSAH